MSKHSAKQLCFLFDPVDTYIVCKISNDIAREFVENWHYSKHMPSARNISYALKYNNEIYAIIVYGEGSNNNQSKFFGVEKSIEIKRLCRTEPRREDYPLSKFIRKTIKLLQQEIQFQCVVAYADPQHNHKGGIYKATGFIYKGMTAPHCHFVNANGKFVHSRRISNFVRRTKISRQDAILKLGLTPNITPPKHRWALYNF